MSIPSWFWSVLTPRRIVFGTVLYGPTFTLATQRSVSDAAKALVLVFVGAAIATYMVRSVNPSRTGLLLASLAHAISFTAIHATEPHKASLGLVFLFEVTCALVVLALIGHCYRRTVQQPDSHRGRAALVIQAALIVGLPRLLFNLVLLVAPHAEWSPARELALVLDMALPFAAMLPALPVWIKSTHAPQSPS
jgi:hypothetical protein